MRSSALLILWLLASTSFGTSRWAKYCPSFIAERFWIGSFANRLQVAADPTKHQPEITEGARPPFQFTWRATRTRSFLAESWSGVQFYIEGKNLRVALAGPKNLFHVIDDDRIEFQAAGLIARREDGTFQRFDAPPISGDAAKDAKQAYEYWAAFITEFIEKDLLYRRYQLPLVSAFAIDPSSLRGMSGGFSWWPIREGQYGHGLESAIQLEGVLVNRPSYSATMPAPNSPWLVSHVFFRSWGIELRVFRHDQTRVHYVPFREYLFGEGGAKGFFYWLKEKGAALFTEGNAFPCAPGFNASRISRAPEIGRDPENQFEPIQFVGKRVRFVGEITELRGREGVAMETVYTRYIPESGGVRTEIAVDFGAGLKLNIQGGVLEILGPAEAAPLPVND